MITPVARIQSLRLGIRLWIWRGVTARRKMGRAMRSRVMRRMRIRVMRMTRKAWRMTMDSQQTRKGNVS